MNKLLIFLIIPAVLSTTTSQPAQQQDASIIGYQFLTALVNAARSIDYSIFAPNFEAPIYNRNFTVIREVSKEALFQVLQGIPQSVDIEQVFPRDQSEFLVYERKGYQYLYIRSTEEGAKITFTVKILGENQFSLEQIAFFGVPGLIRKFI